MPDYCKHCKVRGIKREVLWSVSHETWVHRDSGLRLCGVEHAAEPYREPAPAEQDLELVKAEAERMKDPPSYQWYPRSRDALALLRIVVRLAEKGGVTC